MTHRIDQAEVVDQHGSPTADPQLEQRIKLLSDVQRDLLEVQERPSMVRYEVLMGSVNKARAAGLDISEVEDQMSELKKAALLSDVQRDLLEVQERPSIVDQPQSQTKGPFVSAELDMTPGVKAEDEAKVVERITQIKNEWYNHDNLPIWQLSCAIEVADYIDDRLHEVFKNSGESKLLISGRDVIKLFAQTVLNEILALKSNHIDFLPYDLKQAFTSFMNELFFTIRRTSDIELYPDAPMFYEEKYNVNVVDEAVRQVCERNGCKLAPLFGMLEFIEFSNFLARPRTPESAEQALRAIKSKRYVR